MDAIPFVDDMVKEYLLFRGYVKTYTTFTSEKTNDQTNHPEVEPIAEQLLSHVRHLDLPGFSSLWQTLESRFFTHLPGSFTPTILMLEKSLQRAFLVKAIKTGHMDKVTEFFARYSHELTKPGSDWEPWFVLPYIKSPATHPRFEVFFAKRWFHTLSISLKNFLATVFDQIPLPKLLAFNQERLERKSSMAEIRTLKAEVERLRSSLRYTQDQLQTLQQNGYRVFKRANETEYPDRKLDSTRTGRDDEEPFVVQSQEVLLGHSGPVNRVRFSADGNRVAAGSIQSGLRIYSLIPLGSNDPSAAIPLLPPVILPTPSSSSSSSSSSTTSGIAKKRTASMATIPVPSSSLSSSSLLSQTLSTSSSSVGSSSVASNVILHRTSEAKRNGPCVDYSVPNSGEVLSLEWDTKNENLLLFGTNDSKIKLWNIESAKVVCEMETSKDFPCVLDLATSPTDAVFVSTAASRMHDNLEGARGDLCSWSLHTGRRVNTFHIESVHTQINAMVINHNGNMLVTGGSDGMVRVFDMVTALPIMGWPAHEGQVASVRFCSDETTVLSVGLDGEIVEWSMHRIGKIVRRFKLDDPESYRSSRPIRRPELSLDGNATNFVVSGSDSGHEAYIYSLGSSPSYIQLLRGHMGPVITVDWHPSGRLLTGSADHTARVTLLQARGPKDTKR